MKYAVNGFDRAGSAMMADLFLFRGVEGPGCELMSLKALSPELTGAGIARPVWIEKGKAGSSCKLVS
jgi:hypothetical protein